MKFNFKVLKIRTNPNTSIYLKKKRLLILETILIRLTITGT